MHPLADYAAKELKLKRIITIADDFAFGHEQMAGFQRVFEDAGGRIVKKLWPPLVTPDYTPYLAQISGVDAVVQGFAGSNPVKFMKQYQDQGLKLPVLGGGTACDEALMKSFGDEVVGVISCSAYTGDLDTPTNKRLIDGMVKDYGNIPGLYSAGLYINGMVAEAALEKTGGKTDDKDALIRALRSVSLVDTPRGPFTFDHLGNVVGAFYIRRCEKKGDKLVNTTIKTYPKVSQFWTYDEKWFLSQPVYSRDFPRSRADPHGRGPFSAARMSLWVVLAVNSITLGGLLFLLSAGFSLIFGLMKIPNLTHGSFFMLGAYLATSLIAHGFDFWTAAIVGGLLVAALGGLVERLILRRLIGAELAQVLVTLGLSFMIADVCLLVWTGDPIRIATPSALRGVTSIMGMGFPTYRLAISLIAVVVAVGLWAMLDRTRLGAMIRAGVDDPAMARVVGIRVSRLFTIVFCLGAWLAGFAGVIGGPILSVYPGLDQEMLPLALVVVILGGSGSLVGSLVGSFVVGFLYNFGQAMFPELAYVVLFLPMLVVLVVRPQGLFGRPAA